jgi:phage terminase large subunit
LTPPKCPRKTPKQKKADRQARNLKARANNYTLDLQTPIAFQDFLQPSRYKGAWGGRGSGKSHFFAELLIERCLLNPGTRAVCIREVQKSLDQSVKLLLEDKIKSMGVAAQFRILHSHIETPGGGIITFQGMQNHTAESVKSLEGYDVAWVEEAQSLSQRSLDLLRPTIRKPGSELWFTWNPGKATDPVDMLLRGETLPPDAIVRRVNYQDNPWFPEVLAKELEWDRSRDPDKYKHVWLGEYNSISAATVFRDWREGVLDVPEDARPLFGADWGFAIDPTTGVRCWLLNERLLYIDREVYEVGCEIDATPALFDKLNDTRIPNVRIWPMRGDSARPETISYMNRQGFTLVPATKGAGSVDEGVAFLKSIDIVVHPDCKHVINELIYYSYATDKLTGKVLPVLLDKKNHMIDAIRYALEDHRKSLHGIIEYARLEAAKATAHLIGRSKPPELPSTTNGGVRMKAPNGTSTAYGMTGTQYNADANGVFIVSADDVGPLRAAGFVQVG